MTDSSYPCPCCGYLVLHQSAGSLETCPICCWKDHLVQLAFPMMSGGANAHSLHDAQKAFQETGASDAQFTTHVRPVQSSDQRDPGWRTFDPANDPYLWWESLEHRQWWKKFGKPSALYWWRSDFWLIQQTPGWRFHGAAAEGQPYPIEGIDVWQNKWQPLEGELAIVKDPHHGKIFQFSVHQITAGDRQATFAAGEFSNGIWGFYVPDSPH